MIKMSVGKYTVVLVNGTTHFFGAKKEQEMREFVANSEIEVKEIFYVDNWDGSITNIPVKYEVQLEYLTKEDYELVEYYPNEWDIENKEEKFGTRKEMIAYVDSNIDIYLYFVRCYVIIDGEYEMLDYVVDGLFEW